MISTLWATYLELVREVNNHYFMAKLILNPDGSGSFVIIPTKAGENKPYPEGFNNQSVQSKWDSIPEGIESLEHLLCHASHC